MHHLTRNKISPKLAINKQISLVNQVRQSKRAQRPFNQRVVRSLYLPTADTQLRQPFAAAPLLMSQTTTILELGMGNAESMVYLL